MLSESPTFAINESFGSPEKMFSINFSKANKTFCLSLYYAADSSYLFVNDKEIFKFKVDNENVSFPAQFCQWLRLMKLYLLWIFYQKMINAIAANVPIKSDDEKFRYKFDCNILHTLLLVVTLLLIIAIICYHYSDHR